jgi:hypothetical protein
MESRMEIWENSRILKTVVRQACPPVDACGSSSHVLFVRCIDIIFFGPMGHSVRNKYSIFLNMASVIMLLLYM